jgi:hypothetical protein
VKHRESDIQTKLLQDPTAVLTMILRGTVAKPDGMLFYEEWSAKDAEIERLREVLRHAIRLIRQGKAKFAPHTTNSEVDEFLLRHDSHEGGE